LKFGDLSVEKTWEAFKVLKGKRLTGSFGLLWGVKIPDAMTDDMPQEDLPYLEMLYKFAYGKQSYYDLLITRHVEPKADNEIRKDGRGESTRTDARISAGAVAQTDGAYLREGRVSVPLRVGGTIRKKPHWKLPPKTRVRLLQRIRRWDGIMYNIDLFPYVEHRLLAFIS